MDINDIKNGSKKINNGFYVLTGDEEYLKNLFLKYIKNRYDEYNTTVFSESTSIEEIQKICDQAPFFAQYRLCIITGQVDESGLYQYTKNLPDTTCLIYEISSIDKRKSIFKEAAKRHGIFEFNKLNFYDTINWITSYFSLKGYKIGYDAASSIYDISISLRDAVNKADMLISYIYPEKVVSKKHVYDLLGVKAEDNIFKFIDMIEAKNASSLKMLKNILSGGANLQYIISMLLRHYRLLIKTKILTTKKLDVDKNLGVKPYECKKFKEVAAKYPLDVFIESHKKCLEAEKSIKSGYIKGEVPLDLLIVNLINKN